MKHTTGHKQEENRDMNREGMQKTDRDVSEAGRTLGTEDTNREEKEEASTVMRGDRNEE